MSRKIEKRKPSLRLCIQFFFTVPANGRCFSIVALDIIRPFITNFPGPGLRRTELHTKKEPTKISRNDARAPFADRSVSQSPTVMKNECVA